MLTNRVIFYLSILLGQYCRHVKSDNREIRDHMDFTCEAVNGKVYPYSHEGHQEVYIMCAYCNQNRVWIAHNSLTCRDCNSNEYYYDFECHLKPTSCPTGQFLSGNSCQWCAANTYKTGTGINSCSSCPTNSDGPYGSSSQANCVCKTGFTGSNGGVCTAIPTTCPPGRFLQHNICAVCLPNTYKSGTGIQLCTACPNNSEAPEASGDVANCICNAKAVRPTAGGGCVTCQTGYFKSSASVCTVCGPLRTAFQENLETCLCIAGYGENSNAICELCPRNTYTNVIQGDVRMIQKCIVRPRCILKKHALANR